MARAVDRIDVNADAGEAYGVWLGTDIDALFEHVSSVNLACGFHAADPVTMMRSVRAAQRHGNAIGAHPGYPDLVGFGRRDMDATPDEVYAFTLYQVGALDAIARACGATLAHVKAHGALYLRMARDRDVADAFARAVADLERPLPMTVLAGPSGASMRAAAEAHGVATLLEAFPDRAYLADGSLAPRRHPAAIVDDPAEAAGRAIAMVTQGVVEAIDGSPIAVEPDTLCVHGDNPGAVEIARAIAQALDASGIAVANPALA